MSGWDRVVGVFPALGYADDAIYFRVYWARPTSVAFHWAWVRLTRLSLLPSLTY